MDRLLTYGGFVWIDCVLTEDFSTAEFPLFCVGRKRLNMQNFYCEISMKYQVLHILIHTFGCIFHLLSRNIY